MQHSFATTLGTFGVEADDHAVVMLFFPGCLPTEFSPTEKPSPLLLQTENEISEYFAGKRDEFSVPVKPSGSEFMRSVWHQLCRIRFGQLKTYGDIAKNLGNPGASRAVGHACKQNPIPLLIPCHRVVGADNQLVGFSGGGIEVKKKLIEHEMGGLFARKKHPPRR